MAFPLQPTGNVSPDGRTLEVTDPLNPEGYAKTRNVTVPQYLSTVDDRYLATHPWEYPRAGSRVENEPAWQIGQALRRGYDTLGSSRLGSGVLSGLVGAGGGLAATFAYDALGNRLFGKEPMGATGRLLAALAAAALSTGAQQYYRTKAQNAVYAKETGRKTASFLPVQTNTARLEEIRRELSTKVTLSDLPYDLKTRLLRVIGQAGGSELVTLARVVAPIAGAAAGAALARFVFGDAILPKLFGAVIGGLTGHNALKPRLNSYGRPML